MSPLSERITLISDDEDLIQEIEDLESAAETATMYKTALDEAIDKLIDLGVIPPTPQAKYLFRTGQRIM